MPTKVLLWSPKGSGLHYNGPGMTAYRLYSSGRDSDALSVDLAHGFVDQENNEVFNKTHLISPLEASRKSQIAFLLKSCSWVRTNARNYDVFHGLGGFGITAIPAFAAQRAGLPSVIKMASHRSELVSKPTLSGYLGFVHIRRKMVKTLSGIICTSQAIRDEMIEYGVAESKLCMIPNGVETQTFSPVSSPEEKSALKKKLGIKDMPTLCFAGSMNANKGIHLLIGAVKILKQSGQDCQLVIMGPPADPEYVKSLQAQVESSMIQDRVIFAGFVVNTPEYLKASDICCMVSAREGMPNSLIEGMSTGLACIATRISGTNDLIAHEKDGIFVDRTDEDIAKAVDYLLKNPGVARQLGAAARNKMVNFYSNSAVLEKHRQLFKRIIEGKPAAG